MELNYYNEKIEKILSENKSKLIEAFVMYYGEEYRNLITNKINDITFCWGITDYFKKVMGTYNKSNNNYSQEVLEELDSIKNISLLDDFVCFSNKKFLKYEGVLKEVFNKNSNVTASFLTFIDKDELVKLIYFDMFYSTNSDIIHEINHLVTTTPLSVLEKDEGNMIVQKVGLSSFGCEKVFFEELINERTAIDINSNFNKLGGKLSALDTISFNKKNYYSKFLPLIEKFYIKYKDILKRVRITNNLNELYRYIDKEKYLKYIELINKIVAITKGNELEEKYIIMCDLFVNSLDVSQNKKL